MLKSFAFRSFSSVRVGANVPVVAPKYFIPRAERTTGSSIFYLDPSRDHRLKRRDRQDSSRDVNFTAARWAKHKSVWRHWRHLSQTFRSGAFQRLAFPDLFVNGSIATALTYYNGMVASDFASQLTIGGTAMAGATTAIGILAGFRVHASYARFDEARCIMGEINNAARDLAGNSLMWLETTHQKDRMLNLIKAFPISVHWLLNDKGGHYLLSKRDEDYEEQLDAEYYAEMLDIFEDDQDPDFVRIIEASRKGTNVPLAIASGMRQTIASNKEFTDAIYNREMDEQVQRLVGCLGMCERVLRTPLPVCFTRHSSRLFFLWSNLLPFAMYGSLGLATAPASLMVSWAILGIEDVGVQLEEPFDLLPLRQYSEGMYSGVNDIRETYLLGYPDIKNDAGATPKMNGHAINHGRLNGLNSADVAPNQELSFDDEYDKMITGS
jgi:putative membrane protein